ncbi:MAG: hypothetical protein U0575_06860 [Phycisphaerales bacterium]
MQRSIDRIKLSPRHGRHVNHGLRRCAVAMAGAMLVTSLSPAAVKNWNVGDGDWSLAGNWSPLGVPGAADSVFIGNTVAAKNDWVNLDVNASIASLSVTDGMMLDGDGVRLLVSGDTLVSGHNQDGIFSYPSRIRVDQSPFALDFVTDDLTVTDEAWIEIEHGATMRVNGLFSIGDGCLLYGDGVVELLGDGPVAMTLNGNIQPHGSGLTISQLGTGLIDLDGNVAGDHTINLTSYMTDGSEFSSLTIHGTSLSDELNEDVWVTGQASLTMDLDDGWSMGASSTLRVFKNSDYPGPATIGGGTFTMKGYLDLHGTERLVQFDAPVILESSMTTDIGVDGRAEFNAAATVKGGTHVLGDGGDMDFNGPTTVTGGTFVTFDALHDDGTVAFWGPTTWNGDVVFLGNARQLGNASVTGPTTIHATRFDFDGAADMAWSIGNALTINATYIDTGTASTSDAEIDITGTFLGKLTVNLDPPSTFWTMNDTMTLGGVGAILITRLAGDEMRVSGDLNVSGRVQSTADVTITNAGSLAFATGSSALRLAGTSLIYPGAAITGSGAIEVAVGGDLTLGNATSIGDAGLVNDGILRLGLVVGKATVDRFEQGPTGAWHVDIGGHLPGVDHDFMTVSDGEALLDGQLVVDVIDLGGGFFEPQVGDEFEILAAPGTVSGGFDYQPVSFVPGTVYLWDVNVSPSSVALTLDEIVPCPADITGDGLVDGADLGVLLAAWGPCVGCAADVTFDGVVDGADLGVVLAAWGACQY